MNREQKINEAVRQVIRRLDYLDSAFGNECGGGLARLLEGNPAAFGHCGTVKKIYKSWVYDCWDRDSSTAVKGLAGAHVKMIRAAYHRLLEERAS